MQFLFIPDFRAAKHPILTGNLPSVLIARIALLQRRKYSPASWLKRHANERVVAKPRY